MRYFKLLFLVLSTSSLFAQSIDISKGWKFKIGDQKEWSKSNFYDKSWDTIQTSMYWEAQGFADYDGYAWYRLHVFLPSSLINNSLWKDSLEIKLGWIDDWSETYLNGVSLGIVDHYRTNVKYKLSVNNSIIKWNKENVIAIRVLDRKRKGGMYFGPYTISMCDITDYVSFNLLDIPLKFNGDSLIGEVKIYNNSPLIDIKGTLKIHALDIRSKQTLSTIEVPILLNKNENKIFKYALKNYATYWYITVSFTPNGTANSINYQVEAPYILTPKVSDSVKINTPAVFGAHSGHPFLYKIPATGKTPLTYNANNLPKGLSLNAETGIITGKVSDTGNYSVELIVKNNLNSKSQKFNIVIGDKLSLTPPLGWASWNAWGKRRVSDDVIRKTSDAMVHSGLINYGYSFINIDDGWEGIRDSDSILQSNEKFPDMKALSDYIHSLGLKAGIYSSPGPRTCGNLVASYKNEMIDARTYAEWGIDYLKYDLCSYVGIEDVSTLEGMQKPYRLMRRCLDSVERDIVYAMCQYGMLKPWEWGAEIGTNLWRTTSDIDDTWYSLTNIGFIQDPYAEYAKAGHWNDPDMLVVGTLGYGFSSTMHYTQLTPSEQYTHITLWSLLAAPLLISCDLMQIDDFTFSLLANSEMIEVNQDALAKQAKLIKRTAEYDIWAKPLFDGSYAVGIFNKTENLSEIHFDFALLNLSDKQWIRDIWRQKTLGLFNSSYNVEVPRHGAAFIKLIAYNKK